MQEFDQIVKVMRRLRNECPWDKQQNLQTLRKYLLEEAYECVAAINEVPEKGPAHLIEELGDVLLQVLFQSELLSEITKKEVIREVITTLEDKLVRRHPHVFGDQKSDDADFVYAQWNEIKKAEKGETTDRIFPKIKGGLTSLQTSQEIGKAAKNIKFDWNNADEVWNQVKSEEIELHEAKNSRDQEMELGDFLFSIVQWARHKGYDAEVALAQANQKFLNRFEKMEKLIAADKVDYQKLDMQQKEEYWTKAKQFEK